MADLSSVDVSPSDPVPDGPANATATDVPPDDDASANNDTATVAHANDTATDVAHC